MDFSKLADLSLGLAAFLGALWLVLQIIKALRRDGNGGSKSAGLTAQEWKNEIRAAVKDMLFETAPRRHEELEKLMEKVMEREFIRRDKTIRSIIREEMGRRDEN